MDRVVDVTVPGGIGATGAPVPTHDPTTTDLVLASARGRLRHRRPRHARPGVAAPGGSRPGCACSRSTTAARPEHPWPAAVDDAVTAMRWIATEPAELGGVTGLGRDHGRQRGRHDRGAHLPPPAGRGTRCARRRPRCSSTRTPTSPTRARRWRRRDTGFGLELRRHRMVQRAVGARRGAAGRPAGQSAGRPRPHRPADRARSSRVSTIRSGTRVRRTRHRLRDAGVLTTLRREPGLLHNFLLWDTISPACAAAGDRVADDLAVALAAGRRQGG